MRIRFLSTGSVQIRFANPSVPKKGEENNNNGTIFGLPIGTLPGSPIHQSLKIIITELFSFCRLIPYRLNPAVPNPTLQSNNNLPVSYITDRLETDL